MQVQNVTTIEGDVVAENLLSPMERARSWFLNHENPYQFECGEVTVRMQFSETNDSLQDKLTVLLEKCQNKVMDNG